MQQLSLRQQDTPEQVGIGAEFACESNGRGSEVCTAKRPFGLACLLMSIILKTSRSEGEMSTGIWCKCT